MCRGAKDERVVAVQPERDLTLASPAVEPGRPIGSSAEVSVENRPVELKRGVVDEAVADVSLEQSSQ